MNLLYSSLLEFQAELVLAACALVSTLLLFSFSYVGSKFFKLSNLVFSFFIFLGFAIAFITSHSLMVLAGIGLSVCCLVYLVDKMKINDKDQLVAFKHLHVLGLVFMFLGFAFLYKINQSFELYELFLSLKGSGDLNVWEKAGTLSFFASFALFLGVAPFHSWVPGTYDLVETGVTYLLMVGTKVMWILLLIKWLALGLFSDTTISPSLFSFFAALSMLVGGFMALVQTSLKKIIAYGSIFHIGGIWSLFAAGTQFSVYGLFEYLIGFVFASFVVLAVLAWLENKSSKNLYLDDISDLSSHHPWASWALMVSILSLAGMPFTYGFIGRLQVLFSQLESREYAFLVVWSLSSLILLYSYFRIVSRIYFAKPVEVAAELRPKFSLVALVMVGGSLVTILLGYLR